MQVIKTSAHQSLLVYIYTPEVEFNVIYLSRLPGRLGCARHQSTRFKHDRSESDEQLDVAQLHQQQLNRHGKPTI
eukprot:scaffold11717_cov35-Prasinocladus_malaysianus.AAC.1